MRFIAACVLMILATITFAQVPTRTPPSIAVTKKMQKANALRAEADALENANRKDMEELGVSVSNKIAQINFDTSKFSMKVKSVSWMHDGLAQVAFDFQEKD